ncbi:hypothetical protein EZMO1_1296 [Endozoicomonas montiporae CL-33]|nr:hypothetical protein EZMO1_1296 [Endozoicomonas montiporae CL-33]
MGLQAAVFKCLWVFGQALITQYCSKSGGIYDGKWCHDPLLGQAIFNAQVGNGSLIDKNIRNSDCSAGQMTAIIAVTSEGSNELSKWNNWTKNSLKYVTASEKKEIDNQKYKNVQKKVQDEAKRKNQQGQLIVASGVGTKVCKLESGIVYAGFVERIENSKIKVSVVSATLRGSSNIRPSGFQQTITWDKPENWYSCN